MHVSTREWHFILWNHLRRLIKVCDPTKHTRVSAAASAWSAIRALSSCSRARSSELRDAKLSASPCRAAASACAETDPQPRSHSMWSSVGGFAAQCGCASLFSFTFRVVGLMGGAASKGGKYRYGVNSCLVLCSADHELGLTPPDAALLLKQRLPRLCAGLPEPLFPLQPIRCCLH